MSFVRAAVIDRIRSHVDNRFTAAYRFDKPPKTVFKGDTERIAPELSGQVISAAPSEKRR
jgi:hypothetical protein